MKSLYRYQKLHYGKITVKRDVYERIRKIAEEKQMPMSEVVRMLLEFYEKHGGSSELGAREGPS